MYSMVATGLSYIHFCLDCTMAGIIEKKNFLVLLSYGHTIIEPQTYLH